MARDVDGVWVFASSEIGGGDAALTGEASVQDGCLVVAGHVPVWRDDLLAEGQAIAAQVAMSGPQAVDLGGVGRPQESELDFACPAPIAEHCGGCERIWYVTGTDAE